MNTRFDTNWRIMPSDCNYMSGEDGRLLVFGGALFSQLDLAAAACVTRLLYDSECDKAVTFMWEGKFHAPSYSGDIIFITALITELRNNSVTVSVLGEKEALCGGGKRETVATGKFVFVTKKGFDFHPHGLRL